MCQPAQSQIHNLALGCVLNANGDPAEGIHDDKQVSQGLKELPGFLLATSATNYYGQNFYCYLLLLKCFLFKLPPCEQSEMLQTSSLLLLSL